MVLRQHGKIKDCSDLASDFGFVSDLLNTFNDNFCQVLNASNDSLFSTKRPDDSWSPHIEVTEV